MMEGERLMCVWQAASVMDKESEEVQYSTLANLTSKFRSAADFRYSKKKFKEYFKDTKLSFEAYHQFITTHIDTDERKALILDRIEKECWKICAKSYSWGTKLSNDAARKLWIIFNQFSQPGSYPPMVTMETVTWLNNVLMDIMEKSRCSKTDKEDSSPDSRFSFQNLLDHLLTSTFEPVPSHVLQEYINELFDKLARQMLKAGYLYKRTLRGDWGRWRRRWFVLMPGKLVYYTDESERHPGKRFEIQLTDACQVESMETGSFRKSGMPGTWFRITGLADVNGMEFRASHAVDKREWLKQLRLSINELTQDAFKASANPEASHESNRCVVVQVNENMDEEKADKEEKKIKAIFNQVDTNGNGAIERDEFHQFIRDMGAKISREASDGIFDSIDTDSNGVVHFKEFYVFFLKLLLNENEETSSASAMRVAFLEADRDGSGAIGFKEFANYAAESNQALAYNELLEAFSQFDHSQDDEIDFDEFKQFAASHGLFEKPKSVQDSANPVQKYLKDIYKKTDSEDLGEFLKQRWKTFCGFKRYGGEGELVMTGSENIIKDVLPGQYNLIDLACFNDLPPIIPKYARAAVSWKKSDRVGQSGQCVLPPDFDGSVPIEVATNGLLAFYGANLADGRQQVKVSLAFRHGVQDFTYGNNYLHDYVTNTKVHCGAGIEKHEFSHLDCPLEDDSGYFILGKIHDGELYLTAFKVPTRHTLYVPSNVIHSNDYLKGTWRTMLSDEAAIDHVQLVKPRMSDSRGLQAVAVDGPEELEGFVLNFTNT